MIYWQFGTELISSDFYWIITLEVENSVRFFVRENEECVELILRWIFGYKHSRVKRNLDCVVGEWYLLVRLCM